MNRDVGDLLRELESGDLSILLSALRDVGILLESDAHFMHELGARGGHLRLLRLTEHTNEVVRQARPRH
jgi:hypothetical protein